MPKDLTETRQWETVAVPVGTDPATASSVETPLQTLTDRSRFLRDYLLSLRLVNWGYVAHDSFANWIGGGTPLLVGPRDICYDASLDLFTAVDQGAITIISTDPGAYTLAAADHPGGEGDAEWAEESADPQTCGGTGIGGGHGSIEIAAYGGRRVVAGDGTSAGEVAESSAVGTWTLRSTVNAVAFGCVDHDGSGLFAIGGASGKIETSPTGATWTNRSSGGVSDTIRLMRHNRLSGGSALWMALSDTRVATSADGLTWSSALHGLSSTPLRLDYDEELDTWMAVLASGAFAVSDDDGATWTETANPFGLASLAPLSKFEVGLASDRRRGVVVTFERYSGTHPTVTAITSKRFVSRDGGAVQAYSPKMYGCQRGGVCFGGGRFVTAGDVGGNHSLRALDS